MMERAREVFVQSFEQRDVVTSPSSIQHGGKEGRPIGSSGPPKTGRETNELYRRGKREMIAMLKRIPLTASQRKV
jgi:hypothetical protein